MKICISIMAGVGALALVLALTFLGVWIDDVLPDMAKVIMVLSSLLGGGVIIAVMVYKELTDA